MTMILFEVRNLAMTEDSRLKGDYTPMQALAETLTEAFYRAGLTGEITLLTAQPRPVEFSIKIEPDRIVRVLEVE